MHCSFQAVCLLENPLFMLCVETDWHRPRLLLQRHLHDVLLPWHHVDGPVSAPDPEAELSGTSSSIELKEETVRSDAVEQRSWQLLQPNQYTSNKIFEKRNGLPLQRHLVQQERQSTWLNAYVC